MQIENNTVVSFHYVLSGEDSAILESSRSSGQPVVVLIGHGGIIPGLEQALVGHVAGDKLEVDVEPAQAYGLRRENAVQRVPKKYFRDAARLRPGMIADLAMKDSGSRSVMVLKVGSSVIDVDLNHPLAGRRLHFDIEILAVRQASGEEVAHGHVHGPEGVQHESH
jgi:FKBP-type peptidyl-prolyl cis-trans isomerase SlyD